jgi:hypothetical protein
MVSSIVTHIALFLLHFYISTVYFFYNIPYLFSGEMGKVLLILAESTLAYSFSPEPMGQTYIVKLSVGWLLTRITFPGIVPLQPRELLTLLVLGIAL